VDKARGAGGHGNNNKRAGDAEKSTKNHDRQSNTSNSNKNSSDHNHDSKHTKAVADHTQSHQKDSVPQNVIRYDAESSASTTELFDENNDKFSSPDGAAKSSTLKSVTYAEPMVRAADYDELKKFTDKLQADLKDYKNKIKMELLQVLDVINVDFLNRIVLGIESLMLRAYHDGTYVIASVADLPPPQSNIAVSKPIGTRKPSVIANTNTSSNSSTTTSSSVFDVDKPLAVSNHNYSISDNLASPMTVMTDSFSVEEDTIHDDTTVSVLDDDNKSYVSGSNYGIARSPKDLQQAAKLSAPAFTSSFPLVINQQKKLKPDDFMKLTSSLTVKAKPLAATGVQKPMGLKLSKLVNEVVLDAKKTSLKKTLLSGLDMAFDNTTTTGTMSSSSTSRGITGIDGDNMLDETKVDQAVVLNENLAKWKGNIHEEMKKAMAASTADINRFMLTDMEDVVSNAPNSQKRVSYSKKGNHHGSSGTHHTATTANRHKNVESSNDSVRNSVSGESMYRSADSMNSLGPDDILGGVSAKKVFNVSSTPDLAFKPVDANGKSLFAALKQQLPIVADNVLVLISFCFNTERDKHFHVSQLLDAENFSLVRNLKAAESKCELKDCLLLEAKTKNADYGKSVTEALREKVWALEAKVEKLLDNQVESGVLPITTLVERLTAVTELLNKLKFDSLILKKQATKEESKLKKLIKDTEDEGNEAALIQARADFDGDVGIEKLKQAIRHSAFTLRKRYELVRDRAEKAQQEIKTMTDDIVEHIQAYHRNIQPFLPSEVAANLLPNTLPVPKWGAASKSVTDSSSLKGGDFSYLSASASVSSLDFNGDNSSFRSNISSSVSLPATLSFAPSINVGLSKSNQARDELLEKVSKSLSQSTIKYGSVGSMPPAQVRSHVAVRNTTHRK